MANKVSNKDQRQLRHMRLRQKISGTAECPRLSVCFSASNIYAQLIDDVKGVTLAFSSSLEKAFKEANAKPNVAGAKLIGKFIGEKGVQAGISTVVFDRGGFRFHGRVKALADAARESGLKF